jgi:WD40 repeat protein/serine/threonine protein kinase
MIATMSAAKSIFGQALSLPDADRRAAYLDEACGCDAALRAEVDSLLQAEAAASGFLNSRRPHTHRAQTLAEPPGGPVDIHPKSGLGPYKLLEQIGEGGMGTVYLAQQTEPIKRLVAIKLLKGRLDSRQVVGRFEAERQTLALMDHPNIARILDAGIVGEGAGAGGRGPGEADSPLAPSPSPSATDGRPYFVMELVKGVPITKFCSERELALRERLQLFVAVCEGVQHAHTKGIVHRDLKPSNVLVALYDTRPVPKVIDFGVAKALDQKLTLETLHTGYGAIVGTPEYMSPEQASFNQLDVDTRSDVYSLGVLLYELVTGEPPFPPARRDPAGMVELLRAIREDEPTRPSTKLSAARTKPSEPAPRGGLEPQRLARQVRGDLDWIVIKALEKDRSRRYQTASDLAHDVERLLNDEPVEACPPSTAYRLQKFVRRHRVAAIGALAVAASLLIGTTASSWLAWRAVQAEQTQSELRAGAEAKETAARKSAQLAAVAQEEANTERNKALAAAQALEAALAREQRTSYVHRIALAQREWGANEIGRARELLAECPEELRGWEWRYVRKLCDSQDVTYRGHDDNVRDVAYSPDGQHVASIGGGEVRVWKAASGEDAYQIAGGQAVGAAFSRDGKVLAVAGKEAVTLHDAATGKEQRRIDAGIRPTERFPFPASLTSIAISDDGKIVAAGGVLAKVGGRHGLSGGVAKVWNAESGELLQAFDTLSTSVTSVALSPDGTWVAAGTSGAGGELPEVGEVRVWNLERGVFVHHFLGQAAVKPGEDPCSALGIRFSPDSQRLAAAHSDGKVRIWNLAEPNEPKVLAGHKGWVGSLDFSRTGDRLASVGKDRVVRVWDTATGSVVNEFRGQAAAGQAVAFSPTGRQIASAAGSEVRLWNAVGTQECLTIRRDSPDPSPFYDVAFDPAGRELALASMSKVEFRDAVIGAERKTENIIRPSAMGDYARVAYSPDGQLVATVGIHGVKLWNVKSGAETRLLPDHPELGQPPYTNTVALAFRPDGKHIATTGRNVLTIWDTATGEIVHKITIHGERLVAASLAYSPDGKSIATAVHPQRYIPAEMRIWNAETGEEMKRIEGGGRGIRFSPDGKRIAASHQDKYVGLWDVASGELVLTLKGHAAPVSRLTFHPDGSRIATASADQTIKLWDAASGQEVLTLRGHAAPVASAAFSPDGRYLASSADVKPGEVKVWDTGSADK